MKGITEAVDSTGAPVELMAFKNRLARSYGAGRISQDDFDKVNKALNHLVETVRKIDEKEPVAV